MTATPTVPTLLRDNGQTVSRGFKDYYKNGLFDEVVPVIPLDATIGPGSSVSEANKSKTPGVRKGDVWYGLQGQWSDKYATKKGLQKWDGWGAYIGLQARKFRGCDIDDDDPIRADAVEALAVKHLGWGAPLRFRQNSGRRLLVYLWKGAGKGKKVRLAYKPPNWKEGDPLSAVELLGKGQHYVCEGFHKSGVPLEWRDGLHACDMRIEDYPEIGPEEVDSFYAALRTLLESFGCAVVTSAKTASGTVAGTHDAPRGDAVFEDNPSLWAMKEGPNGEQVPAPEHVLAYFEAFPNDGADEGSYDYDIWIERARAAKFALGPEREKYYPEWEAWMLQWADNTKEIARRKWDSFNSSDLGWNYLQHPPEIDFDDNPVVPEIPCPVATAEANARERMFSTSVYVRAVNQFGNLETGDLEDEKSFNVRHKGVAEVGRSGIKSAANIYLNHRRAEIADVVTYRPGKPAICEEEVNGMVRTAFNTYRPPALNPPEDVTDADIDPWLDLWTKIFGARGTADCEHALNWMAFVLQRPGEKPNHCLAIVGPEGVGKDSVFEPLRRGVGKHNVATIGAKDITGPQNDFWAQKQLVFVNEVHNFTRRETMDALKPYIAAPPDWIIINAKYVRQYQVPNLLAVVMFTNYGDALAPTEDDRRYFIHRSLLTEKPSDEVFTQYWDWLDNGGDAKVVGWLLARDISAFNPHKPAPMTQAKRDMIAATQPAPLRWCRDQLREVGQFADRDIMSAVEIEHAADRSKNSGARDVTANSAVTALRAEGFEAAPQVRSGTQRLRLWVRGPRAPLLLELAASNPKQFVAEYHKQDGSLGHRWEGDGVEVSA